MLLFLSRFRNPIFALLAVIVFGFLYWGAVVRVLGPFKDLQLPLEEYLEFAAEPEAGVEGRGIEGLEFRPLGDWKTVGRAEASSVYWFRLSLDRLPAGWIKDSCLIELDEGRRVWTVDSLRLYLSGGEGMSLVSQTGYAVERTQRSWEGGGFALPVLIEQAGGGAHSLYIRAAIRGRFDPNFRFWSRSEQRQAFQARLDSFALLNLGATLSVVLFVGLIAIRLKSPLLGYYLGYLGLVAFNLMNSWQVRSGNGLFWEGAGFARFTTISLLVFVISYAFLFAFTRIFLGVRPGAKASRLLNGMALLNWAFLGLAFGGDRVFVSEWAAYLFASRETLFAACLIGLAIVYWKRGQKEAGLYVLSFSVTLALGLMQNLTRVGIVEEWAYPFSELSLANTGIILGAFILAIAATDRLRLIQVERDRARGEALENLQRLHAMEESARHELELKVEQRTQELSVEVERSRNAEKALEVALGDSEEANRAKSAFLAAMSHELRTPLNAILGYAQLLGRPSYLQSKGPKAVETIKSSGEHLLELINDVLNLSKLEAGKVSAEPASFDLLELLRELVAMLRVSAEQKGVVLRLEGEEKVPQFLLGDRRLLRQILINLLGNAIKFTDSGSVRLVVESEGEGIVFRIVDTGVGIEAEALEDIFEPFSQSGSEREKAKGTGLGLAISRKLARQMGGDILVESELGKGSEFRLMLVLAKAKEADLDSSLEVKGEAYERVVGYKGERRCVLVVDDDELNRSVLGELLEELSFEAIFASDGREALDTLAERMPNLVIMDLEMPRMNGLEATREIRNRREWADLPVVALTASVLEESQRSCLEAGCSGFFVKPVKRGELLAVLEQQLKLEWIRSEEDGEHPEGASLVFPPRESLEALRVEAKAGHVKGVRTSLEALGSGYERFREEVESRLAEFDLDGILELVEAGLDELK
ncbi:ATP-binding protein [Pelagicoccus mobilis]|uniref:histidine kinase n=1 Tax=Pelagicoccus mobilis TaxID=415221 RepID=A0A934VQQ4_9BACT|nr:ATP-binding protein [Pelagicoccus mobilis]MBK1876818.1 response regulator [Pelagicoccus mobilis]